MGADHPAAIRAVDIRVGLTVYYITSAVVGLGMLFGNNFLQPPRAGSERGTVLDAFLHFDGLHYKAICVSGYNYNPSARSEVAFFPAYPLLARGVMAVAGCSAEWALLLVANLFLAGSFVGLHIYTRQRFAESDSSTSPWYVLLAFGILPTTFFFRMAYSESIFLAASLGTLIAIQRRQSVLWVAVLCGLTTITRPVGVAFLPVFLWYLWQRSVTVRSFLAQARYLAPLACWGILAYMIYQCVAFGDPLAFAKTQQHWKEHPDAPFVEKSWDLLRLEPLWNMYSPSSPRYWVKHEWHDEPLFSLVAANPIYFALTALLIALGAVKRWLNSYEILLGMGLLLIPYLTRGYDNSMLSAGRFAAAVLPSYLVLGQLLNRLPTQGTAFVATASALMLGAYSALFAAGYLLY